jgi:HEPN domain-containing protein
MTKEEHIDYWLKTAEHDWDTANHLFNTGKYDWCLFISHLVIEKVLKAFWVRDSAKRVPHKHNLLKIAEETRLNLSEEQKQFLDMIAAFNIKARYPDAKFDFYKLCTKEFTTEQFEKIRELYQWLLSQIKSEQVSKNSSGN